jgi:cytochrome c peroxidase
MRAELGWTRGLVLVLGLAACGDGAGAQESEPFDYELPTGFPAPNEPVDNPTTRDKAELGRHLFYDRRLSLNGKQACATCHRQELAFTDGKAQAEGSTGAHTPRGSMSIVNAAYAATLTWANPNLRTLEQQALVPLFGEIPIELGFSGREDELLRRLRAEPRYQELFPQAFPELDDPFSIDSIVKAIAAFERTIISGNSPVDRYRNGDRSALGSSEQRGLALFYSERFECFHCHSGFNYSLAVQHQGLSFDQASFENNGLYNLGGTGDYPETGRGLYDFTFQASDRGRFKPPSLRNIALTAPYMHDGSLATLEDVLAHYAAGGTLIESGSLAGDGRAHPNKSRFIRGFEMSAEDQRDLLAFLRALSDEALLRDARFSDPWPTP